MFHYSTSATLDEHLHWHQRIPQFMRESRRELSDARELFGAQQFGFALLQTLDDVADVVFQTLQIRLDPLETAGVRNGHGTADLVQLADDVANRHVQLHDRAADGV